MGQAYALVLINNKDALHFNIAYPRRPGIKQSHADGTYINYQPTFPQELVDEINRLRSWNEPLPKWLLSFCLKNITRVLHYLSNGQTVYMQRSIFSKTQTARL